MQQDQQRQQASSKLEGVVNLPSFEESNLSTSNSKIVHFYKNKKILLTGGSGFLGKVVLWKLLDACPDVAKIYILLRPKNNTSAHKRLIKMLKNEPFTFKHDYIKLLEKVVAIESDITADNLGLSQTDRTLLEDEVNIVFHSAASVSFDAPLKDNLRDNVFGTRSVINLCNNIKNLQGFVHVSTAYSNCQLKNVKEQVLSIEGDLDETMQKLESLPDDLSQSATEKLLEGRPNTYTYTKALAEQYVVRQEGKFPISIVRPSIVIPAYEEPCQGWIDNVKGITGLTSLAAVGLLRTMDWNYHAVSDMVPVDRVANCLICVAYQICTNLPDKVLVYNMTSGNASPISWGRFFEHSKCASLERPPTNIVRPIIAVPKYDRVNPISFFITKLFSELLFAFVVDVIFVFFGHKARMTKLTRNMQHGYEILKPFTTNQWCFQCYNVTQLSESLTSEDRNLFKFDMRGFDWEEQAWRSYNGARQIIFKDQPTELSYEFGRKRHNLVTHIHHGLVALLTVSFLLLISFCFRLFKSI